jgi:hypothetical protein
VAVGVGDVALAVGVADTVGDGVGLADEAAHDGDGVGDGVTVGTRSATVFGAVEVTEPPVPTVRWSSWLVRSTMRDGGQSAEGAGLADAAPLDSTAP